MPINPQEHQDNEGEPFKLLQLLGTGGFGHTWKAQVLDDALREEFGAEVVAIKVPLNREKARALKRELAVNALFHLRLKELQAVNIVRYLGFDIFQGQHVMAMEFVSHGSLRRRLGEVWRQKPQPLDEAINIAEGVLKGLVVMHGEHVIHRDIKPENILMQGDVPKIADFGISRMLDASEQASTTAGTLPYMSPEILSEEGGTHKSDVWSLGVMLYEMVTGKLPFGRAGMPIAVFIKEICTGPLVPADRVRPEVPRGLSEIIDRALQKRVEDRYQSADEMLRAVVEFRQKPDDRLEREIAALRKTFGGQPEQMESKLREFVAKHSREALAYHYLGEFYNSSQRFDEAQAAFKQGLNLKGNLPILHWDLALALQGMGQRKAAAESLERAVELGLGGKLRRHAEMLLRALKA
jgi:serine/threonine protein kinase